MIDFRPAILQACLAGLALTGCAGFGPSADRIDPLDQVVESTEPIVPGPITHGIFSIVDKQGDMKLILSPGQGFIMRNSKKGCALIERRGSWSMDPDTLYLVVRDVRSRTACDAKWERVPVDSNIVCPIRMVAGRPLPFLGMAEPGKGTRWQKLARINTAGPMMDEAFPPLPVVKKKRFSTSAISNGKQARVRS